MSAQLESVLREIDRINAEDPNTEPHDGGLIPKELLYSRRMTDRLMNYAPDASHEIRIAARAQHIQRWQIPRTDYPMTRAGYIKWRTTLGQFHAGLTASLMNESGWEQDGIDRVKSLLRKELLKSDPDTQLLEDVICLVFIEHYLEEFAAKHSEEKMITIIKKTWRKMSERARTEALALSLPSAVTALVGKALA